MRKSHTDSKGKPQIAEHDFWNAYRLPQSAIEPSGSFSSILSLGPAMTPSSGASWREQIAVELLIKAMNALDAVVEKRRGRSAVEKIRRAAKGRGMGIFALAIAIDELKGELAAKKRGPKPTYRSPGQVGRKRRWTPQLYQSIIHWFDCGAEMLRQKGKPITNESAFREFIIANEQAEVKRQDRLSSREIERWSKEFARRLPDARRALAGHAASAVPEIDG